VRALVRILLAGGFAFGVLTAVIVDAEPAGACTCLNATETGALERSAVAFIGTALPVPPEIRYPHATNATGAPYSLADRTLRFRVERVFKGDVAAEQELVTPGQSSACGISVDVGTRYLVFGASPFVEDGVVTLVTPEPGQYLSYLCDGTRPARLDERPPSFPEGTDLARGPVDERESPAPVLPESSSTQWFVLPVVMGALVIAIAAGMLFALRRRDR
jgi:hypothetical protein